MNAQVELIRIYGANPAIAPQEDPEVGVVVVSGTTTQIANIDAPTPTGVGGIPIPSVGENLSIIAALALRVVVPADPVTQLSNVRFFFKQGAIDALGGQWDGARVWTPASTIDPDTLNAFIAFGGSVGAKDDYLQATRSLGAQGWLGDSLDDVYGIADREDMLAFPGDGRIDLTGKGRADGTTGTFGQSVNDVSRMLLMQYGLTPDMASGTKPVLTISCRYDESL